MKPAIIAQKNEEPPFIGDWYRERKLGTGAFGVVNLWKNKKTNQSVAIKRCHMQVGSASGSDAAALKLQTERWIREVDYMTNHIESDFIVRGIKIEPAQFVAELERTHPSPMPTLIMEYCEGGDLRRMLNANANTSGLAEPEVRSLLRCLGSAIEYLHQKRITHRDIKPENIVIKPKGAQSSSSTVYKLTDLGYAKPLDRNSLVASLVGTLEYIAPELCFTDKYSNTVDYWSLGIIAAEVVTGSRPFVPHLPLAQWINTVKTKKSDDIFIDENNEGTITVSAHLPDEHRLSKCFRQLLEPWLRLALEWNPKQRGHIFECSGGDSATTAKHDAFPPINILKIFTMLDSILKKRILSGFCMHTYQDISYECVESMKMSDLLAAISKDCSIPSDRIRLILPLANDALDRIEATTRPVDLYWPANDGHPMFYVICSTDAMRKDVPVVLPPLVASIMSDAQHQQKRLRPHVVRRFVYNAYHYVRGEQRKYETMLGAMHCYALRLNHEVEIQEPYMNRCMRQVYELNGAAHLLTAALQKLQNDLNGQSNDFLIQSFAGHRQVADDGAKLMSNTTITLGACEQIEKRYKSVQRRSRQMIGDRLLTSRGQDHYGMVTVVDKAMTVVREKMLQRINNNNGDNLHMDMFKCVYNCLKKRDQLLRSKEFIAWNATATAVSVELHEIQKALHKAVEQVEKYRTEVDTISGQHQTLLWSKVNSTPPAEYLPDIDGMLNDGARVQQQKTGKAAKVAAGQFRIGQEVTTTAAENLWLEHSMETTSLIQDNEQLRLTLDELMKKLNAELK